MTNGSGLFRSNTDKVIAGVCGGLGKHLKIDPVLLRVIFVLLSIFALGGLIAYVALWIALPVELFNPEAGQTEDPQPTENGTAASMPPSSASKGQLVVGLTLITIGAVFLVTAFIPRFNLLDMWPVVLIGLGVLLLNSSIKGKNNQP